MKAKHHPLSNLGKFAHAPRTNIAFAKPVKAQTRADSPKIIGPKGDKGKPGPQPHKRKS